MRKTMFIASSAVTALVITLGSSTPVLAWHPVGVINKSVQNVTANGGVEDANDAAHAVSAKPGDVLRYTVTVANNGKVDNSGNNDMASTVLTDTLPAGVELTDNPSKRTITENIGVVKPQNKITKTYTVKVVSTTDGAVVTNKACFTGDSKVNDNPQSGCDNAVIKVTIPVVPVTPTTPTTPEQPQAPHAPQVPAPQPEQPQAPAELPATGSGSLFGAAAVLAVGSYAWVVRMRAKRAVARF